MLDEPTPRPAGGIDRFRLRAFLDVLADAGDLEIVRKQLALRDIARHLDASDKAVLFAAPGTGDVELAGNVVASRRRLALALGVEEKEVFHEVRRRVDHPVAPVYVSADDAPVQAKVVTGDDVDLTTLPIHLQHADDGGPYISAAIDFVRRTGAPGWNVGCRRLMLLGPQQTGIDLNAPSDLRALYRSAEREDRQLPVAMAIGCHPLDFLTATLSVSQPRQPNEVSLMGGLRQAPVPLVRCVSVDAYAPADAEFVIEGYLDPAGFVAREGPYGEYLGYYGPTKLNPVFRVTAVTSRTDAVFQTATIAGRSLSRTDTAQLLAVRTELLVWEALRHAVREPVAVHVTPASGGMYNARVAIDYGRPGGAKNAIATVLGSTANIKHVFVVDPDVDIFSDQQLDWALATRFQADRDLVVLSGLRPSPLDPSVTSEATTAKVGFDLTRPRGELQAVPAVATPPGAAVGERPRRSVADVLRDLGPCRFLDLLDEGAGADEGEIVRELATLRAAGRVEQLADGLYVLREEHDGS